MKQKILFLLLTISILLSLIGGTTGCSLQQVSTSAKVNPNSPTTIGDAKKSGVELLIPEGTFEKKVKVSINKADKNSVTTDQDASFLSDPLEFSSDGGEHTLGETVTVRMKLPDSIDEKDYLTVMGAYYDGSHWVYILPNFKALQKGYLEFGTPHFSIFAPVKLEKGKALDQYANTLAVQNVTGQRQTQDELSLIEGVSQCFTDTLDSMGFTDKTVQGIIMQKLTKETTIGGIATNIKNGDIGDLSSQVAEYVADAIMESLKDTTFKENLSSIVGSTTSGIVAGAIELYESGDYGKAYKEFVYSAIDFVPAARLGKAVVEATKAGIDMWQDYSVEYAYKVYLDQTVKPDGSITPDSWDMVFHNMGSGLASMKREYRGAYAEAIGKTLKEIDKDKELRKRLDNAVENDIKRNFINRYIRKSDIEAEKAKIIEQLKLFDEYGLLDPDYFLSFPPNMSLTDRIDSLMKIRQSIIDIVGGDLSVFGSSDKKIEDNLAFAVKMWLLYGKDRPKFYDWMRDQGYIKVSTEKANPTFSWVLSGVDTLPAESGDWFTNSLSGGLATYSAHNKETGDVFEGSMTWTEPKSSYKSGETVNLTITARIDTYKWHGSQDDAYLHLGLNYMGVRISSSFDVPGLAHGYGTGASVSLKDEDGKYQADVSTNYGLIKEESVSRDVSAKFPDGSEYNNHTCLYVGTSAGTIRYNYEWQKVD